MKSVRTLLLILFLVCLTAETGVDVTFAGLRDFNSGGLPGVTDEGSDHAGVAAIYGSGREAGTTQIAGSGHNARVNPVAPGPGTFPAANIPDVEAANASIESTANIPDEDTIRATVDSIAREYDVPSVAFAVVTGDGLHIAGATGYADKEKGIAATPGTVYRAGSISKTFIALGIMQLVHEGKLGLDDRLTDIAPEIPVDNRWEGSHPVLLRHLLEHTAGFRNLYLNDFVIPEDTPLPDLHYAVMREPAYLVSRWKPGTRHVYSNPGYTLLGCIIEKYSGMPYHEYIAEVIFRPLGMENSDFLGRNRERFAVSYDRNGNPQTPLPILDHPAGYLHTTPEDMARFLSFMLHRGQVDFPGNGEFIPGSCSGLWRDPHQ
jgi:CubicO group peptidase (beta-lactamase class C family)